MIENCLRHKIIRDFLSHYTENRWKDLIPSLIEIGILNLQKSFNKILFTNEEIKKVLRHLQISQIEKDKEKSRKRKKENEDIFKDKEIDKKLNKGIKEMINDIENKENIDIRSISKEKENKKEKKIVENHLKINDIFKPNITGANINNNSLNVNFKKMKIIDIITNDNYDKVKSRNDIIKNLKNNINNNYHCSKNNIIFDSKNKLTKQNFDYYKKINIEPKNKNIIKKQIDKISYAISYDKDLNPEIISKKINKSNTSNNTIYNINTKSDKDNYNSYYSSDKKNNSKSKGKNQTKNKEIYLNLNSNSIKILNNIKNVKKRNYYLGKQNRNVILHTSKTDKNNFFRKVIINQNNNAPFNEINNNFQAVKINKLFMNRINSKNPINMKISNSYNNNYYQRNLNSLNTLNRKLNTIEKTQKNDNYFSNINEFDEIFKKNRIFNKINIKNIIIPRKKLTGSERLFGRNNIFLNIDEKSTKKEICNYSENYIINNIFSKNNSFMKKIKKNESNKKNKLFKVNHINNLMKINILKSKTPKNSTINIRKNLILNSGNRIKEIKEIKFYNKVNNINENKINYTNSNNKITELDSTNKLFDKNKIYENNENNNKFKKVNGTYGDCRYFNLFGKEGEDSSLTYKERDFSGMMESSTSNNIQMSSDFFLKESPINVFKRNESEYKSNNNSNNKGK